jgi:IS5 family transposase
MDKRFQLGILDQLASGSGQVSRSTKRLQQIDEWIDWQPLYKIGRRIDKADSTRKGGRYYFGYKGHIGADIGSKLIRKVAFTPASPHDSTVLVELISEDERSLFGDKVYGRDSLKQIARENGWYYGLLDKGKRDGPLSGSALQLLN